MGKQINFYMEFEVFLKVAEKALKNGCEILKKIDGRYVRFSDISAVTDDCRDYYFYLPEAGELKIRKNEYGEQIDGFKGASVVIEAGFSNVLHEEKIITRNRLYIITGYYDDNGEWIPRPECIEKVYNKLVYLVKKETKHLGGWEYATPEMLELVRSGYMLR